VADLPRVNEVGDLVLTDPRTLRALADPERLALFDRIRREGPDTAAELAARDAQLEELAELGLVARNDDGRWQAIGKGFVFEVPEEADGQAAARQLSNTMMRSYVDLPERWIAEEEPRLELEWARAAGLFNARVQLTPDELEALQEGLERLLEPLITRAQDGVPNGARPARILAFFLPEAGT
jgi:DNA-binding transcriptional ArsR family regulator